MVVMELVQSNFSAVQKEENTGLVLAHLNLYPCRYIDNYTDTVLLNILWEQLVTIRQL